MNVPTINSVMNNNSKVAFKGGVADGVANVISKVGNSDAFVKGAGKLANSKNLMANLSTASSAVTTSLYVYRTLTDKKKDMNQKITFTINQVLSFAASTAITYLALGALKNKKNKLVEVFADAVTKRTGACSDVLKKGADAAVDLVTCSFVNRYLSPVAVTPLANKLGDFVSSKFTKKSDVKQA